MIGLPPLCLTFVLIIRGVWLQDLKEARLLYDDARGGAKQIRTTEKANLPKGRDAKSRA